jgi:amino acid transporter
MTGPSDDAIHRPIDAPGSAGTHHLRAGAVGLSGVIFLAVTSAAPISAMLFNAPIAIGYGNGIGAPAGFIFATVMLTIFTVGYVAMARKVTTAGGFYGFISMGLGREAGMAAGLLALVGYAVIEASLLGAFSVFGNQLLIDKLSIDIPWQVLALGGAVAISILTYYRIDITAQILGAALIAEVVILLIMYFSILFQGGKSGISLEPINPLKAFEGAAPGIGIFFAFWSWVGFEATANYGEESRDPKRIIPRATYIAVIGLGIFYSFTVWMVISGWGLGAAIKNAAASPATFFYPPTTEFSGQFVKDLMEIVIVTGSFACAMAFHNTVSRYFFAMGREGVTHRAHGRTHPRYGSPYIASLTQTGIALAVVGIFAILKRDPFLELYGWMAILATLTVLVIQSLCCLAVINFFRTQYPDEMHWWRTVVAPLIAFAGQVVVIYLLLSNLDFVSGGHALFVQLIPWIVLAVFLIGIVFASYLKRRAPDRYERLGRITLEGAAGD